jgi:hypothetical protein
MSNQCTIEPEEEKNEPRLKLTQILFRPKQVQLRIGIPEEPSHLHQEDHEGVHLPLEQPEQILNPNI